MRHLKYCEQSHGTRPLILRQVRVPGESGVTSNVVSEAPVHEDRLNGGPHKL